MFSGKKRRIKTAVFYGVLERKIPLHENTIFGSVVENHDIRREIETLLIDRTVGRAYACHARKDARNRLKGTTIGSSFLGRFWRRHCGRSRTRRTEVWHNGTVLASRRRRRKKTIKYTRINVIIYQGWPSCGLHLYRQIQNIFTKKIFFFLMRIYVFEKV